MKSEATIKVKPRRENLLRAKGLAGLFELVFYRKPSLGLLAIRIVAYVQRRQKEGNPMGVSEWKSWIKENQTSQRQYYDVVNKLVGIGMLRREEGSYRVAGDFSQFLRVMAEVWDSRSALQEE